MKESTSFYGDLAVDLLERLPECERRKVELAMAEAPRCNLSFPHSALEEASGAESVFQAILMPKCRHDTSAVPARARPPPIQINDASDAIFIFA